MGLNCLPRRRFVQYATHGHVQSFTRSNIRESNNVSYIRLDRLDLLWGKAILDLNLPGRPISPSKPQLLTFIQTLAQAALVLV
jgi:hypothetical protein